MPLVNDTEERTVSVISQYSFYTDNIHAIFLKQMRKEGKKRKENEEGEING